MGTRIGKRMAAAGWNSSSLPCCHSWGRPRCKLLLPGCTGPPATLDGPIKWQQANSTAGSAGGSDAHTPGWAVLSGSALGHESATASGCTNVGAPAVSVSWRQRAYRTDATGLAPRSRRSRRVPRGRVRCWCCCRGGCATTSKPDKRIVRVCSAHWPCIVSAKWRGYG